MRDRALAMSMFRGQVALMGSVLSEHISRDVVS